MPLSPEDVSFTEEDLHTYAQKGYWISPVLFDEDEVAAIRREVVRTCNGERDFDSFHWLGGPKNHDDDSPALRQVSNSWWVNKAMRELTKTPVIAYIGSRLMNTDEVRVWNDQALIKPGLGVDRAEEDGGNVGWHQDKAHWQCTNTDNLCTAWVALQDTDPSNGCMRVVAGSRKWGLFKDAYTFVQKDLEVLQEKYKRDGLEWIEEPCVLKAGQASFHHALTFHGSGPNLTEEPRMSFTVHMMPQDCAFTQKERYHANADLLGPFVKEGDLFDGPYFPRIWPAEA